jgi:hypothetical protein
MRADEKEFKELMSLVMSQSIERYNEMDSGTAHKAIADEWDASMAEIFEVLIFGAKPNRRRQK